MFISQLLVIALAACTGSFAYNYRCLQPGQNSNVVVKEFMMAGLIHRLPGCRRGHMNFCKTIGVMYTDRQQSGSDAYIAIANRTNCENSKAHIVDALGNEDEKIGFNKVELQCKNLTLGKANNWLDKGYSFRALLQCYDNICLGDKPLEDWQKDQRKSCKRYLNE